MGIITIDHADRLYWLGRYTERVYTTIRLFSDFYDRMLEGDEGAAGEFCAALDIPNIYQDRDDFRRRYLYDQEDPNAICVNLERAYDNAVVMRDELGSESLCYIQLAMYEMNKARISEAPMLEMMKIRDNILAFWGIIDDQIESENVRNIIKIGKRIERIDLYARLHMDRSSLQREYNRLKGRIDRCGLRYDQNLLKMLGSMVESPEVPYGFMVHAVDSLILG